MVALTVLVSAEQPQVRCQRARKGAGGLSVSHPSRLVFILLPTGDCRPLCSAPTSSFAFSQPHLLKSLSSFVVTTPHSRGAQSPWLLLSKGL